MTGCYEPKGELPVGSPRPFPARFIGPLSWAELINLATGQRLAWRKQAIPRLFPVDSRGDSLRVCRAIVYNKTACSSAQCIGLPPAFADYKNLEQPKQNLRPASPAYWRVAGSLLDLT